MLRVPTVTLNKTCASDGREREGGGLLVNRRGPNRTKDIPGGKGGEGDGGEEGEDIEERGGLGA